MRSCGAQALGLMTQPSGARLPFRTASAPSCVDRVVYGADHVVVVDFRAGDVLAQGLAGDGQRIEMQLRADAVHQRRQAAGIVEVFHQVGVAAGPDVGDHRHVAAGPLEVVQADVVAGAARHGDQVDDRVGGAAHGHGDRDGVLEGGARLDRAGVRSSHTISTMRRPHSAPCGYGWRRRAGIEDAPGSVMPIDSAMAVMVLAVPMVMQVPWLRAMPASTSTHSASLIVAGAALVPELPGVRAGAQHLALPVAAQHRAGRQVDGRQAGAGARPSAGRAWSCRSRPSARRRRPDASAAAPRLPSPACCGTASWSA